MYPCLQQIAPGGRFSGFLRMAASEKNGASGWLCVCSARVGCCRAGGDEGACERKWFRWQI
jgi:hypothetical protein